MILEALNIHKSYCCANTAVHVLRGVNVEINEGEVISIVGPSGAGKSTLLHILGGLDHPDEGVVTLDRENVYSLNDALRARLRNTKVGFVFQFYHLLPEFDALENVILPSMIKSSRVKRKIMEQEAMVLLKQLGLESRVKHRPNQLSGGEQQRVAIARALINKPRVVLCDEPTGNLDSKSGKEIIKLLMELNKNNKQTFVIVTHDDHIAELSHRTIHIRDGQVV